MLSLLFVAGLTSYIILMGVRKKVDFVRVSGIVRIIVCPSVFLSLDYRAGAVESDRDLVGSIYFS